MAEVKEKVIPLEETTFETVKMPSIIDWCKRNKHIDWLKKEGTKKVKVEQYTERKQKMDANGNPVLNKLGNPIYVVDKSSKKKSVQRPVDFMTVKKDFYAEFKSELPSNWKKESKKVKKTTWFDEVDAL